MLPNKVRKFNNIPLSVLDLSPINEGSHAGQSFENSVELAQHVERWGFNRYWLAEHHNMPGIGSSATSLLIGHIANATERIRVGSGGIMLPNHAPLVIAEQFGTLESIYPGRIDLGLGRAPGSDQATAYALRRSLQSSGDDFPDQLAELQSYFDPSQTARVRAFPGEGLKIPIWLLGSSGFSAQLAAQKGLPFSFASHFSSDFTIPALQIYHQHFTPSNVLKEPYAMLGVNVIAAETDEKAMWLATSQQQQMFSLMQGKPTQFKPPIDDINATWTLQEQATFQKTLATNSTIVGNPDTVKRKMESFLNQTKANELIVNSAIFDHEDRIRSYEIIASMMT
ncbi:LLM class flavin-dependent oxidoreductase [Paenisporosarcina indica]|uniref:LLM class flavin-dependent oxidoreductase n=1 Tax=Paenisporosarcina indica TaxID=650093 RepID=UPI00094FBE31|nr:LLM class flavin-dependent oxidoreductase [Paenisporosarcina indica]